MTGLLDAILAFPTVLFTIPLGVVLCYWLTVMAGAVGIDLLDGDLAGGAKAAGSALEGGLKAASGSLEGGLKAASGSLEGLETSGGTLEAGAKAASGTLGAEAGDGLFEVLGLAGVPVTVSVSVVTFFSWLLSMALNGPAHGALGSVLPSWLISAGVGLLSLTVGLVGGGLSVRPLRPLFTVKQAPRRAELMGRVCTVASGRVDARVGHATFEDGGAGLLLHIVCDKPNSLKHGDQALVLGYDAARDAYEVEPVDWLLPEELQSLKDPAAAAALARAKGQVR